MDKFIYLLKKFKIIFFSYILLFLDKIFGYFYNIKHDISSDFIFFQFVVVFSFSSTLICYQKRISFKYDQTPLKLLKIL